MIGPSFPSFSSTTFQNIPGILWKYFQKNNKTSCLVGPASGSQVVPCGETNTRTYIHDEANRAFWNFANAPKKFIRKRSIWRQISVFICCIKRVLPYHNTSCQYTQQTLLDTKSVLLHVPLHFEKISIQQDTIPQQTLNAHYLTKYVKLTEWVNASTRIYEIFKTPQFSLAHTKWDTIQKKTLRNKA